MLEQIRDILITHEGKGNPITSGQIAQTIGIVENATYAKTRALILQCAAHYALPLAAGNQGYYLITNSTEFDEYIANLNSRIAGIEERKQVITKNFERWNNNR